MTISLNCDADQLKAHKASLTKKHATLDAQINELSRTAASRIANENTIKQLKAEKMPLKRAIAACDEHLGKLESEAAKKAREKAAAAKSAEQQTNTPLELIDGTTLKRGNVRLGPNGLPPFTAEHAAA